VSADSGQFDELGLLAAALCDGAVTPAEAARLNELVRRSPEARRDLIRYLHLHGQLYWDLATGAAGDSHHVSAGRELCASLPGETRRLARRRPRWLPWGAAAAAAALLLAVAGWLLGLPGTVGPAGNRERATIARVVRTVDADWGGRSPSLCDRAELRSGEALELRSGLAEIEFRSGARVILEGPSLLESLAEHGAALSLGRLSAQVPPTAHGFALQSPWGRIVDLGTEFGLSTLDDGTCEVHVFSGRIEVWPGGAADASAPSEIAAGQALRLSRGPGGAVRVEPVPLEPGRFVRALPKPDSGSVAAMRRLAAQHPRLIHHYSFEGTTPLERYRDQCGSLHLMEVVMCDGRGQGRLRSAVRGFDATTNAVAPHRAVAGGNTSGVALQSDPVFQPPPEMTIELLLRVRALQGNAEGAIASALATRDGPRHCSVFLAAVDGGHLGQLMDVDAPWVECEEDFVFIPEHWYYVASTFRVEFEQTRVNTYVANLSQGEWALSRIVKDQLMSGIPVASRLGIGKGFDSGGAHSYPWSGELDEVAIYDAVLDPATLQQHLDAIVKSSHGP